MGRRFLQWPYFKINFFFIPIDAIGYHRVLGRLYSNRQDLPLGSSVNRINKLKYLTYTVTKSPPQLPPPYQLTLTYCIATILLIFLCTLFNNASSATPQIPLCRRMRDQTQDCCELKHWQPDALTTRLDLIHSRLDLIHSGLDLIHLGFFFWLSSRRLNLYLLWGCVFSSTRSQQLRTKSSPLCLLSQVFID